MISTLFLLPFKWLLYGLSFCVPRRKNLWVFGSRQGQFVDNPKYLFLHTAQHHKNVDIVWISSDKVTVDSLITQGFTVYHPWGFKGLVSALRAGCFIYAFDSNDINFYCSGRSKLINLYHGIPLKKIEFDTTVGSSSKVYHPESLVEKLRSRVVYPAKWQTINLFQIPSTALIPMHNRAFNQLISNYFIGENPRLAPLVSNESLHPIINNDAIKASELVKGYRQVWIYMPTWRVGKDDILSQAFPDLDALNKVLKQQDILLIFKMHLYSKDIIENCSHIKIFPPELDVYPFLSVVDVLITDYSSIAFDFDLNKKSIIFYAHDLEDYLRTSSDGFYYDYDEFCNHSIIYNFEQLLEVIENTDLSQYRLGNKVASMIRSDTETPSFINTNKKLIKTIEQLWDVK